LPHQIFFASIGASAQVMQTIKLAPMLFVFSAVAIGVHLALLLLLGKLLGYPRREILLASNANIGGSYKTCSEWLKLCNLDEVGCCSRTWSMRHTMMAAPIARCTPAPGDLYTFEHPPPQMLQFTPGSHSQVLDQPVEARVESNP
jgi:Protein of unknown function (DUF819)